MQHRERKSRSLPTCPETLSAETSLVPPLTLARHYYEIRWKILGAAGPVYCWARAARIRWSTRRSWAR